MENKREKIESMRGGLIIATRSEVEELAKAIGPDDAKAFGLTRILERKSWTYGDRVTDAAFHLARENLKRLGRELPKTVATAETENGTMVKKSEQVQGQERTKEKEIQKNGAGSSAGIVLVRGDQLEDLAGKITAGVAKPLMEKLAAELAKAEPYAKIEDNIAYEKALVLRGDLPKLLTKEGVEGAPKILVRVTLGLQNEKGDWIGIAAETSVGTESAADFFKPLATITDRLHSAITSGRKAIEDKIKKTRDSLEQSVLSWQRIVREREEADRRKQKEIQDQLDRTNRAKHWIGLLVDGKYLSLEDAANILTNPLDSVTNADVDALYNRLTVEMGAAERSKQEAELAEAIESAKKLGRGDLVKILTQESDAPVVVESPAPPPPPVQAPKPSVGMASLPSPKGATGKTKKVYELVIEDPMKIPVEWFLPEEEPERFNGANAAYKRILKAANGGLGKLLKVTGIRIEEVGEKLMR